MVVLETRHSQLEKYVGKKVSVKELEEVLFNLGFELERVEGDELRIEITAERPDLLSTQGLARALRSYFGLKVKPYKIEKSGKKVIVKNPAKEWPLAVAAIVKGLKLDEKKIKEIIRIQEKLGETFLRQRKKGGLGLYPLERITFPVMFTAEDPKGIVFRPLEYGDEINGLEVLERHPTGKKYRHILEAKGRCWERFPVFRGADNVVLSMPPIINAHDVGKVDANTREVFVECTGIDLKTITLALGILVGALIDMGGKAYSIEVGYNKKNVTSPDFKEEQRKIKIEYINKILGSDFKAKDVKRLLQKMGYAVKSLKKKEIVVVVPGTRYDIWHDVDIVDDVARAYGFNNFEPRIKPVFTEGETTRSVKVKEELSGIMIGLGYQEVFTLVLSSRQDQFENMNVKQVPHLNLGRSVEQSVNMPRVWLLPELMKCLKNNRSVEYPQKIFEINQVIVPDETKDVKCKDVLKLCVVLCHSGANFTEMKQVLEYVMRCLDLKCSLKESEHGSFISGRVARVTVNNKDVAEVGEVHPKVLSNFGLEMPVVVLELDLSELFGL